MINFQQSTKTVKKLLIVGFLSLLNSVYANSEVDSLLTVLKKEIIKSKLYVKQKESKINDLKKLLSDEKTDLNSQYFLVNKIIDEYHYYSFDSALLYTEKNIEIAKKLGDRFKVAQAQLILGRLLVDSGRFKEAIDVIDGIKKSSLNNVLLNIFYDNQKEAYSALSYYTVVKNKKTEYVNLYNKYKDSLTALISQNSEDYLSSLEKKLRDNRELLAALAINSKRFKNCKIGTRKYSMVTFERSILYELQKDVPNRKIFLILSAISDIKSNIKDNASLTELAMILYSEDEIDLAHQFITFSMEDAKFYNSQLRYLNISNILTSITKAYNIRSEEQNSKLTNFLILSSLLGLFLFLVASYVFKQKNNIAIARNSLKGANLQLQNLNLELNSKNDDLEDLNKMLSKSTAVKVHYIGTFLNLYSEYIDKLDIYRKVVSKYIITNKTKDLLELTKSKQVIDTELKLFYQNFDESFLQIYPNFIRELNQLLKSDEQITLKNNEGLLNTELRIYALIKLGISNSVKISEILRYSVNTIYNYRVKIKNSAIDRENFENSVKNIL
jgi:hypothetical protein